MLPTWRRPCGAIVLLRWWMVDRLDEGEAWPGLSESRNYNLTFAKLLILR